MKCKSISMGVFFSKHKNGSHFIAICTSMILFFFLLRALTMLVVCAVPTLLIVTSFIILPFFQKYAVNLAEQLGIRGPKFAKPLGQSLDEQALNDLRDDQIAQLYELMLAATQPEVLEAEEAQAKAAQVSKLTIAKLNYLKLNIMLIKKGEL